MGRIYTIVTNIYENSAWVKTNGNFGGFPVGNDILSNFGISLGNPHDVCYLKNHLHTYSTQVVNYLYPGRGVAEKVSSVGFCLHCCRLQAVYSPITVKNFVTVYTAFKVQSR